ncbi:hypothetical protein AUC70_08565 [Methyloceanibacter stevinii]|uniref:Uncharacterized protein n=1 Tax=Methyloceanibacter stevinii TaxID=1774970 RepID=A0A1E3VMA9_9HYPH|nr:hypothetical protein [Methyloceanibacter stevinii]ODR94659.1 hypothetical protein AUC70_08565 [Methyloceanibacter stevinii]
MTSELDLETPRIRLTKEEMEDATLQRSTLDEEFPPQRGDLTVCVDDLREAATHHNDDWLAQRLIEEAVALDRKRQKRGDGLYWQYVNIAYAAQQTAENEFNKLYIRGVCRFAIESGIKQVEVYRAKVLSASPPDSDELMGNTADPESLLSVLRGDKTVKAPSALKEAYFTDTGLSVRLPGDCATGLST